MGSWGRKGGIYRPGRPSVPGYPYPPYPKPQRGMVDNPIRPELEGTPEPAGDFDAFLLLEVERDAALAAVHDQRIRADIAETPAERAAPVAVERLHLDDLGAVLGHCPGGFVANAAIGACDEGGLPAEIGDIVFRPRHV